jgi:polyribonucleotide 5'-hydroxyl-kinase
MTIDISVVDLPPLVEGGERHTLQPREELRFEVAFGSTSTSCSFVCRKGSCELYGCELAVGKLYTVTNGGVKIALFTWHGCVIDLVVPSTSEGMIEISYISEETDANVAFVNTHAQLEALRDEASLNPTMSGPRVMVIGPPECGKTSLVKTLVAYATKVGRTPLWVDLDPMDNAISVPGSLAVAPMTASAVTVETYATTGLPPNNIHPLVVYHGSSSQIYPDLFKGQVDRLAQSIERRLKEDDYARSSGIIVNTNGWIQEGGYDLLLHTVKTLQISVLLILGHDRLYSMMSNNYKKLKQQQQEEADSGGVDNLQQHDTTSTATTSSSKNGTIIPKVLKLPRSGGVVSRPGPFVRQCRSRAVKRYFYGDIVSDSTSLPGGAGTGGGGSKKDAASSLSTPQLTPFLVQIPFSEIQIYKLSSMALSSSLLPVAQMQSTDAIQITQVDLDHEAESLQHALLAVCHPSAVQAYQESGRGRDLVTSGVAGFVAVERVLTDSDMLHLLSPCAGSLPSKTLILGDITWME